MRCDTERCAIGCEVTARCGLGPLLKTFEIFRRFQTSLGQCFGGMVTRPPHPVFNQGDMSKGDMSEWRHLLDGVYELDYWGRTRCPTRSRGSTPTGVYMCDVRSEFDWSRLPDGVD